jgi:hypothetical protein
VTVAVVIHLNNFPPGRVLWMTPLPRKNAAISHKPRRSRIRRRLADKVDLLVDVTIRHDFIGAG